MAVLEDSEILRLFQSRDENALRACDEKYGRLCRRLALHILNNRQDAEECFNDALLHVWNAVPPALPQNLSAYLAATVRNLALDRQRLMRREKRGDGQVALAVEELASVLPSQEPDLIERMALSDALNRFLETLPAETRVIFVLRYWACLSIKEVAEECDASVSKVKMSLLRTKSKLKQFLEKEELL